MELLLGQQLFIIEGRKAALTPLGYSLLPRAKQLLGSAQKLERSARQFQPGMLSELSVAFDVLFPIDLIDLVLQRFSSALPGYRVRIYETALSGTRELLEDGTVELGVASNLPNDHLQETLLTVDMVCVVASGHSLAKNTEGLELGELNKFRQVVIRDSGTRIHKDSGWLGTSQRWTVSNLSTAKEFVERGQGFAWLPKNMIADELNDGRLSIVPLHDMRERTVQINLGYPEEYKLNPDVRTMVDTIREVCHEARSVNRAGIGAW
jgi:DNA-binding transcriptional LysR family regulator